VGVTGTSTRSTPAPVIPAARSSIQRGIPSLSTACGPCSSATARKMTGAPEPVLYRRHRRRVARPVRFQRGRPRGGGRQPITGQAAGAEPGTGAGSAPHAPSQL